MTGPVGAIPCPADEVRKALEIQSTAREAVECHKVARGCGLTATENVESRGTSPGSEQALLGINHF